MACTRNAKSKRRRKLVPSERNPYVIATRRLGHHVKPSIKAYRRKPRTLRGDEDAAE
jgi:hypothetical protein